MKAQMLNSIFQQKQKNKDDDKENKETHCSNTVQHLNSSKDKDSFPREFGIKKRKVENTVTDLFCFNEGHVDAGTLDDFSDYLRSQETWYLVDGVTPEDVEAKTIIALSPQRIKKDEFQEFDKIIVKRFYMGSWSLNELIICQKHVYPNVPVDLMIELYRKAGGVPRYTLQRVEEAMKYYDPETISVRIEIVITSFERVEDAILEVRNLLDIINFFTEKGHIKVTKKLEVRAWSDLLEQIRNYKAYPSACGIMLELYVIHLFITGDCHFETRKLEDLNVDNDECTETYTVKPHPKIECILSPEELASHNEEKVIVPSKSNFGAADLFVSPNDIFQITVSHRHPIKQTELVNIVKNIPGYIKHSNAKIRLYFVVPDDIYENYKTQDIVTRDVDTKSLRKVKTQNSILKNVKQWVIKVDIKHT
ncbi:rxlr effector candidate protein [Gigaspora margarita]|uniref:Rxlr effector candidate protein n=1 Tax=Gigaspora margarita TaxID=4874 RepID=A0A8H4EI82_GIGMA|nr:rxlr effector candidate protein [Gigaspora margarita]